MGLPKPDREFLKSNLWNQWDGGDTDQRLHKPHPELQEPYPAEAPLVDLVPLEAFTVGTMPLIDAIRRRKSQRSYAETPLTLEELSFLLWATQGVREVLSNGVALMRTVPSAGARHPFETYLVINRVEGVEPGLYRYLSLEHKLCFIRADEALAEQTAEACNQQGFVKTSAVTFVWVAVPYRTEWRYSIISPKLVALDAGHVCQNLYLACQAIGAGTCAIAAYNQKKLDAVLGVDGKDAFAVYIAPVGKLP